MRKVLPFALVALAFAAVSCKKEETPGEKLDNAIQKAGEQAGEAQKKADETLKK